MSTDKQKEYYIKNRKRLQEYYQKNKEEMRSKSYEYRHVKKPELIKLQAAKRRSKLYNLPFNLVEQDIKDIWPEDNKCPALGIPFVTGDQKTKSYSSPNLDRIIPDKGYVKGNIQIVCGLANKIMSNATPDQVIQVGQYFKKVIEDLNRNNMEGDTLK
jgi:hypothetical protein